MDRRNPDPRPVRRSSPAGYERRSGSNAARRAQPSQSGRDERYDGRFGSSADARSRRPTGSYRSQPSGSYRSRMDYGERRSESRRPGMHDAGDSYTRRPTPEAPKQKSKRQRKRVSVGSLIALIGGLALLALLIYAVATGGNTVHQLPTIERGNAIITEDL